MTDDCPRPAFDILSGADVAARKEIFDTILALDRSNMESIMRASNFGNFPWDKRIKGLTDADSVIFTAFLPAGLAGYLEIHPTRLENDTIYISSLQIPPDHRGSIIFPMLLRRALEWLRCQPHGHVTTEVQVGNLPMVSILERMGFVFHDGRHAHTRHATISRQALLGNAILKRISKGSGEEDRSVGP